MYRDHIHYYGSITGSSSESDSASLRHFPQAIEQSSPFDLHMHLSVYQPGLHSHHILCNGSVGAGALSVVRRVPFSLQQLSSPIILHLCYVQVISGPGDTLLNYGILQQEKKDRASLKQCCLLFL